MPVAFYAVVSVAVIGLYLAFLIPIWLRWRMGDAFQAGSWNNGAKYKWMNLIAVIEIAIISVYFIMPFVPAGVPVHRRLRLEVRQLRTDPDASARCWCSPSGGRSRPASGSRARSTPSTRQSSTPSASEPATLTLDEAARPAPSPRGRAREVTELPGGLTNHNYRVRTATQDVVVRISPPTRTCSRSTASTSGTNSLAAAAPASAPRWSTTCPGAGVLVVEFLPGTHLHRRRRCREPAPDRFGRAPAARRPAVRQRASTSSRSSAATRGSSPSAGCGVPDGYAALGQAATRVETALRRVPEPLRPLPQRPARRQLPRRRRRPADHRLRVLRDQRGLLRARQPRQRVAARPRPPRRARRGLLRHGSTPGCSARAELWGLAGRYAWTLWGAIQHGVSDVDHDFWDFTLERYDPRCRAVHEPPPRVT